MCVLVVFRFPLSDLTFGVNSCCSSSRTWAEVGGHKRAEQSRLSSPDNNQTFVFPRYTYVYSTPLDHYRSRSPLGSTGSLIVHVLNV